eukprot:2132388-Pleurochrysis_carterae.AAC.1
MPKLPFFFCGNIVPLVISFDATGFGSQQINTIALNNPYSSKSAQLLRIFGLGTCSDDRIGTARLLAWRELEHPQQASRRFLGSQQGGHQDAHCAGRVSSTALRAPCQLRVMQISGCTCDRALRTVPTKPKTISEMCNDLKSCHSSTALEHYVLSRMPPPGKLLPRSCIATGCTYAHYPSRAAAALAEMLHADGDQAEGRRLQNGKIVLLKVTDGAR